jgi:hypothetical protein
MRVQAIKDRWAACTQAVHKVKPSAMPQILAGLHPTQMVNPNKFCSFIAPLPHRGRTELLTSDAVFEPM